MHIANHLKKNENNILPRSSTSGLSVFTGLLTFLLAIYFIKLYGPNNLVYATLLVICCTTLAIILFDICWLKVHQRESTNLDFTYDNPSLSRSFIKWQGLLSSFGFVAFFYYLLTEYYNNFYEPYYEMLRITLIPSLLLALPYIYYVDRKMKKPLDGYWHMGKAFRFEWQEVDWAIVWQHALGWIVKGFFLPLMFIYFYQDLNHFILIDFTQIRSFKELYDFSFDFLYLIDVGIGSLGYLFTLRIIDTHYRSIEPTTLGWVVALMCYGPFSSLIAFKYVGQGANNWTQWINSDSILFEIWGCLILLLTVIYVWSTLMFGLRFSNLTNRGIITNGPYRFTKHPAYLAKNISWWLISIPFIVQCSLLEALHHCLLLLGLNGIYFLRSKTEERHLLHDSDYLQYVLWINNNGLLSKCMTIIQSGFATKKYITGIDKLSKKS